MNDAIRQMLALQERDLELDRLAAEAAAIPGRMTALRAQIEAGKRALEDAKKELTGLQMAKKQKELDLETHEGAIRKHSTDLNAVKTNDAYRALLGEIEKAKNEKSALEDQILQVLDQIDQAQRTWKETEAKSKASEADLQKQIGDLEAKQKELEQQISTKQGERGAAAEAVPKKLAEQYERVRKNRKGAALVPIRKEQCSGCHMKVSQNLINEIRRAQKIIACEHCARIVYLEDTLAAAAPEAAGSS